MASSFFQPVIPTIDFEGDLYNILMAVLCVVCAFIASGLLMGLTSLDQTKVELKTIAGKGQEKEDALKVLPIIKQHHFLLVTILLFNTIANESLPVFLNGLFPNWLAIILSVAVVLIVGELIPSALFTGRNQLAIVSKFIPFVRFLMVVLWPIAYPFAKTLDYLFGDDDESSIMTREDFEALLILQSQNNLSSSQSISSSYGALDSSEHDLESHTDLTTSVEDSDDELDVETSRQRINTLSGPELTVIGAILKLYSRTLKEVMIDIKNVFMISDRTLLTKENLKAISKAGFSRLPVYRKNNKNLIRGYLLVKTLATVS